VLVVQEQVTNKTFVSSPSGKIIKSIYRVSLRILCSEFLIIAQ